MSVRREVDEVAELVYPVPEKDLEGKAGKEIARSKTNHKSFTRLKDQQQVLAEAADSTRQVQGSATLGWRPIRRTPGSVGAPRLVSASVPQSLQIFNKNAARGPTRPTSARAPTSQGRPSPRNPTRPSTAGSSRPSSSGQRQRLSSARKAFESPAPTQPQSDAELSESLREELPQPTRIRIHPKDIKTRSPSEGIGALMSPAGQVRTLGRNVKMSNFNSTAARREVPPPLVVIEGMPLTGELGVDPSLSNFLKLEDFDNDEFDIHTPEEWVARGIATGGTPGRSRYFDSKGKLEWRPCKAVSYDEDTREFCIEWNIGDATKQVGRLNLVFDEEDPDAWQLRVEEAMELRAEAEARIRLHLYVTRQANDLVSPLDEDQIDRILSLVAAEFPVAHLNVVERTITEMRDTYSYAVKKGIFDYNFQDPKEQQRLSNMNLPPPEAPPATKMKGTIDIPPHNFAKEREYIAQNLFFTHHLLYGTLYHVVGRWEQFENCLFVDTELPTLDLPCELQDFKERQLSVVTQATKKLKIDWSVSITAAIQHDLDDHFNFYEDSLERYKASRMSRFLRTINLIMSHQLRSLMSTSITKYVDFASQYDTREDQVVDLKEAARALSGNVPLFVIRLCGSGNSITFEPLLEEVVEVFQGVFNNIFNYADNIPGVGGKLFPLLNLSDYYLKVIAPEDPIVTQGKEVIDGVLTRNLVGPRALKALYDDFEYLFQIDIDTYLEEFAENGPSLEEYQDRVQSLLDDIERIKERSLNEVAFELVKVECYQIKEALQRQANDVATALMNQLSRRTNEDTSAVIQAYTEIYEQIQVEPMTAEELHELKTYCDQCQTKVKELQVQFDHITDAVTLLSKFGFMANEDEFETYWNTYSWPQKVFVLLDESEFKYKENRNRFSQELREDTEELTESIAQLQNEVDLFSVFSDEAKTDEYYGSVKRMNQKIADYKEKIELYNSREVLFGITTTKYSNIKEIVSNFEPYQQLWTIVYNFHQQYPQWHEGLFPTLDAEQIDTNVANWNKTLHRLCKTLGDEPPGQVAISVRDKLEAFKPYIPLIMALRNPGLRDRHWKKISTIVDKNVRLTEETTFNDFLALHLEEHLHDIQELSEYASKEYRLEKQLEKMQGEWKSVQFELAPYGDTHMLKSVDDIQQLLDDHIVKAQTMLGSPYVKAIDTQVKQWEGKLLRLQALLDEWLKCQSVWNYLEPIFTAGDIQKFMPAETQKFSLVNSMWHTVMEGTVKNPYVLHRSQEERILANFVEANRMLEAILKQLQQFLETKRMAFPRFFFLSNEELLEIMAETKDPLLVQPHLKKCFEGIAKLRFEENLDIDAMFSKEGEEVPLSKIVNPADFGNAVESWLTEVEKVMMDSMNVTIKESIEAYSLDPREEWMLSWPGQVVLCVANLFWTREVEECLGNVEGQGLASYEDILNKQMTKLIEMVRGDLARVQRSTLEALVVIEVHNRDTVTEMVRDDCQDSSQFSWLAQLRYYWEGKDVIVKQVNAQIPYGYEYLGNSTRLVITPLTDRCYRTLMGAVHLNLGGAPEGPAGTGKTETTKDLAKALAKHCVVYNCSDQISYREMAKLFKGLASSGAWACFDEFNRIEIQVLSVIAQQVATIQTAVAEGRIEFLFERVLIKLKKGCSVFITMNPGYAGRSSLPDNLKALFRPVAMMVPEYAMIAEISLFSFGFLIGRSLARKIVATYKLCSEQLSSQDHYDYGMRAVKSVLTAAGRLKRKFPEEDEQILMLRSIIDVNLPKFLSQDLDLFNGIVSDLFPGVELPKTDYGELMSALYEACEYYNLQAHEIFVAKTLQIYEMVQVRHGLMVVGYSYAGKSRALRSLARALTTLSISEKEHKTHLYCMNPKSITMGQLYGQNDVSMEWNDGILSKVFRGAAHDPSDERKWLVLDGPVDAIWIENMNTVLDDNKKLCLVNGDMISMSNSMNMIFEVQDLAVASPATVSRCGMIYMQPESLGWRPLYESWKQALPDEMRNIEKGMALLETLFEWIPDQAMTLSRKQLTQIMFPVNQNTQMAGMLRLFGMFINDITKLHSTDEAEAAIAAQAVQIAIEGYFLFALIWSVGALIDYKSRQALDAWLKKEIVAPTKDKAKSVPHKFLIQYPERRTLFDYIYDTTEAKFVDWMDTVGDLKIQEGAKYHEIIVPTTDTARYSFLLRRAVENRTSMMFIGATGTGKSIMVKDMFLNQLNREMYQPIFIQFSAQTTANQCQDIIDSRMEKRRKGCFGPPIGKQALVFVDDVNMPELEEYGAQPPVELLRQWMDYKGWYERKKDNVDFKEIQDIIIYCAMQPPGGGRNNVTPQFARHFNLIAITPFDETTMKKIFMSLLDYVVVRGGWQPWARAHVQNLVVATLTIFDTITAELLPTPEKSHYTFNLRDVSKVFQGMSLGHPDHIPDELSLQRLWVHECERTFADRLVNDQDREWFRSLMDKTLHARFKKPYSSVVPERGLIYADFMETEVEDRVYQELTDLDKACNMVEEYLNYYNGIYHKKMDLVIFHYVLEHLARLTRIIKQPYANALLIGVGGSGRQSTAKMAAHIADYRLFQVSLAKAYNKEAWRDDMQVLLKQAGGQGQPTVFLFMDTQIKEESFLEDISNILNTGEIPNLFPSDEIDNIVEMVKPLARELGRDLNKESLFNFFVERTRSFLHIVLCVSPVGAELRTRLRKFPALVNCCTIDWFQPWPAQALNSVGLHFMKELDLDPDMLNPVVHLCVYMHRTTEKVCQNFLEEMRTQVYLTPTSYLELISMFKNLWQKKKKSLTDLKLRYDNGLQQLLTTEKEVDEMSSQLELLKPTLVKTAKETEDLIKIIERENADAEKTRSTVAIEEAACNKKAASSKEIRDECELQLQEAMPALDAATKAVSQISKKELAEIRSLQAPPEKLKRVMEAVCVCLEEQPKRIVDGNRKVTYDYWETARKKVMSDTNVFIERLLKYDKENMKESVVEKIQVYVKDKTFRPEHVKAISSAVVGLCQWVLALEKFYRVWRMVKPKKETLAIADKEYNEAMTDLNQKKQELEEVDERLAKLRATLDKNVSKKEQLELEYETTEKKLSRATKLMAGLGGEKVRYTHTSFKLTEDLDLLLGEVLMSAGTIAYLGPFTSKYRAELTEEWLKLCKAQHIPGREDFNMATFLGEPVQIQQWQLQGLPSDPFSVDNALICTASNRWPLLVDPQGQANKWIKNMERNNKFVTLQPCEGDYIKSICQCIRKGFPVILENVGEDLDSVLDPLLLKQVFRESGMLSITIGDTTVEYNENFRLYITTKFPRPHYRPETSVKVTITNFAITPKGLEDQLLQKVVQFEEREVEERKNKFVLQGAQNQARLKETEDEILNLLSSGSNLLDDEECINTLDNSKRIADDIGIKQSEIEASQRICDRTRAKFLPVASRGSLLFFCIMDLANIDPMYQYSLQWFIDLFGQGLKYSDPDPDDRDRRIQNINNYFTYSLYKNVCRSLFEKDKLLVSFAMACRLMNVDPLELRFLLTGGLEGDESSESPASWLPSMTWEKVQRTAQIPSMSTFPDAFKSKVDQWKSLFESSNPQDCEMPLWQSTLLAPTSPKVENKDASFEQNRRDQREEIKEPVEDRASLHKLIILRCLRPDKLVPAISNFVSEQIGEKFVQPPIFDLASIFLDSRDPWVPLIFVLSSGADPYAELMGFAESQGMAKRLESLSLGQGMGKRAADQIQVGKQQGLWVLLQNCHLYSDWMPSLEKIVEDYSRDDVKGSINHTYRLWLTSMPSDSFPVSILQNGIKMIIEAPRGLRANLMRSFMGDPLNDKTFFDSCTKPGPWKRLLFGICFFHAVVQERRSFGPLGWNTSYEFNETDLRISVRQLHEYLNKYEELQFDALNYLAGHCNYGGRVTDDRDRRCLMAILGDYYTEDILNPDYKFGGLYSAPARGSHEDFLEFIQTLPSEQPPEVFGLHANGNITREDRATSLLLDTMLLTQPRTSTKSAGSMDPGEVVVKMAEDYGQRMPEDFDLEATLSKYPITYHESMNTVLYQEMVRYNRLLVIVRESLQEVIKAVKGEIVMSPQLESLFNSIYDGKIPKMWMHRSFPSLKPLGGYIHDLLNRIQFLTSWYEEGPPVVFWLSGFFFTQSFLTGVLQNYARKNQIEIDTLSWSFEVMSAPDFSTPPADGCYVKGMFLQGATWSLERGSLAEAIPKEQFASFPILWMRPNPEGEESENIKYACPLYKTSERRGTLSTTGHSTNFVMSVLLQTDVAPSHWVKRGTALLCQLDY